ncbi:hypothetical protein EK904_003482, partial [Melospiza melodia maxima]
PRLWEALTHEGWLQLRHTNLPFAPLDNYRTWTQHWRTSLSSEAQSLGFCVVLGEIVLKGLMETGAWRSDPGCSESQLRRQRRGWNRCR